jgi:hypothetical protein
VLRCALLSYAGYIRALNDTPPLTQGPDGNYYDAAGNQWQYDPNAGEWVQVIGHVTSVPNQFSSIITAYNFINGLAPWFYGAATLGPLTPYIPFDALIAHITSRGATWFVALQMMRTASAIRIGTGVAMTTMTSTQANALLAEQGYTDPPWLDGVAVYQFTTNASFEQGLVDGEQLVHITPTAESASYGSWLMMQNSLTYGPNGSSFMSAAEANDLYSLPTLPQFMAPVTNIPPGTPMLMGVAAPVPGWGSGGGIQFYVQSGSSAVTFGAPQAYP